ncbi:uncharacterized protein LOC118824923 [Colossoma macropomum]|uniref:uncharacterized protein LOC118824923 n=1 Tax=Colossoma macropomum TaxID=42526 RepID=UPI001863B725|nr:uncharacterized protein LOC118824923 [Colossoma macropomum]
MKLQYLLWLIFLFGPCMAGHFHRTNATTSEGHRHLEPSQLELLSLGQKQLLSDLDESTGRLVRQDSVVSVELDRQMQALEEVRRRGKKVGRMKAQVKADLQLLTARGERLQTAAWRLRDELGALKTSQNGAVQRIKKVLAIVLLLSGSAAKAHSPVNIAQLKEMMDSQSRRLSKLSLELTTHDELMVKRQKEITDLEQQVSHQGATQQEA